MSAPDDVVSVQLSSMALFILGAIIGAHGVDMYTDNDGKSKGWPVVKIITGALFILPGLVRLVACAVLG